MRSHVDVQPHAGSSNIPHYSDVLYRDIFRDHAILNFDLFISL